MNNKENYVQKFIEPADVVGDREKKKTSDKKIQEMIDEVNRKTKEGKEELMRRHKEKWDNRRKEK